MHTSNVNIRILSRDIPHIFSLFISPLFFALFLPYLVVGMERTIPYLRDVIYPEAVDKGKRVLVRLDA